MSRRPLPALPPGAVASAASMLPPPPPPPAPYRRHYGGGVGAGGGGVSSFDHTAPRPPVPGEECVPEHSDWGKNMQQQQVDYPAYQEFTGGDGRRKQPYLNHLSSPGYGDLMPPPPLPPPSSKQHYHYNQFEYAKPMEPHMKGSYKDNYNHHHHHHQHQAPLRQPEDPRSDSPSYTTTTTTSTSTTTTTTTTTSSGGNTVSCLRWAESLHWLLQDADGGDLFRRFLRVEHPPHADALDFWFACEGLRAQCDADMVGQLVRLIYKRYFRKPTLPSISEELRTEIGRRVKSLCAGQTPSVTLFDDAQSQIEEAISNNTYRNFLESDMYLQHVQAMQCQTSCSESGSSSSSSNNLANLQKNAASLPTIYEDSPPPSLALQTPGTDCLNSGYHTPRLTENLLLSTQSARSKMRPMQEEEFVCSMKPRAVSMSGPGGAHPRPSYVSYNPVSRQDSEQQSVSSQSDVCTDTDNRSHTDSSVDGRSYHRHARQYARLNPETQLSAVVIPRTQRRDSRHCPPRHPDEFAALLTDKLNAYLRKQNEQELFKRKLQEIETTSSLEGGKCRDQDLERTIKSIVDEDDIQGILDDHVSRVFSQDHSPGVVSPRRYSPTRNMHRPSNVRTSKRHRDSLTTNTTAGSTFSADSGNVHDYYSDHPTTHPTMTKSHSMPEYYPTSTQTSSVVAAAAHLHNTLTAGGGGNSGGTGTVGRRSQASKRLTLVETDSGVSVVSDAAPAVPDRVLHWVLESDIGSRGIAYTHSEMSHGSNSSRHHSGYQSTTGGNTNTRTTTTTTMHHYGPAQPGYGNSRSSSVERSGGGGGASGAASGGPAQPFVADPSLPPPLPPNTASQLEEAVKRLEDMRSGSGGRQRMLVVGGTSQRMPSRHHQDQGSLSAQSTLARSSFRSSKSGAVSAMVAPSQQLQQQYLPPNPDCDTRVLVKFCEEEIPYRITIPGHQVTLRQFKEYLPKKGIYRYFFKTKCDELDNQVIQEEVSHDDVILPLWEGKIITATVKPID